MVRLGPGPGHLPRVAAGADLQIAPTGASGTDRGA